MNSKISRPASLLAAIITALFLAVAIGSTASSAFGQDDAARKARTIELIAAASHNQISEVKRMLAAGYDVNGQFAGDTALHTAIHSARVEIVKLLLEYGADLTITEENYGGLNALQLAEKQGKGEIAELIRQAAAARSGSSVAVTPAAAVSTVPANTANAVGPTSTQPGVVPSELYSPSWEKPSRFRVGETVLYSRDRGKAWQRGTITKITKLDHVPRLKDILFYQIDDLRKVTTDIVDTAFVTTLERQGYWTEFFAGDWNLTLPMAVTERVQGNNVYRVYSGAGRLPPLRVNVDGSYSWTIDKNKVIRGSWKANENGPGLVLLNGDRGDNWILYNTSEASERESFKTDTVRLVSASGNFTPKYGTRIQDR